MRFKFLIFGLSSLLLCGCKEEQNKVPEPTRPVKVFHVSTQENVVQRSFPGKVEASKKADLAFLVEGKIIELPVKEGERVKKGQLIAKLDPKDFEIALQGAESKVAYAKVQLDRSAELLKQGFTPQSKHDALQTAYDVAIAARDTAQQNLDYSVLRAPFDGEIAVRYVDNFQTIKVKEPIVALHNRDHIDINIQIPENLAIRSTKGVKAVFEVEFDSAPGKRYPVHIKELASNPDPDTQTYKLTLTLHRPSDLNIFPGMTTTVYGSVKLDQAESKNLNKIPITAVFSDEQNKSYVWLIQPTTHEIKKQSVKIEKLEKDTVVVSEGLSPGMDIVAAGAKFLREGMKVRPLNTVSE